MELLLDYMYRGRVALDPEVSQQKNTGAPDVGVAHVSPLAFQSVRDFVRSAEDLGIHLQFPNGLRRSPVLTEAEDFSHVAEGAAGPSPRCGPPAPSTLARDSLALRRAEASHDEGASDLASER